VGGTFCWWRRRRLLVVVVLGFCWGFGVVDYWVRMDEVLLKAGMEAV
jgi:hypothetical protein